MKRLRTELVMWLVVVTATCLLVGCNTFEGMGRDFEALGNAIAGDSDDTTEFRE